MRSGKKTSEYCCGFQVLETALISWFILHLNVHNPDQCLEVMKYSPLVIRSMWALIKSCTFNVKKPASLYFLVIVFQCEKGVMDTELFKHEGELASHLAAKVKNQHNSLGSCWPFFEMFSRKGVNL